MTSLLSCKRVSKHWRHIIPAQMNYTHEECYSRRWMTRGTRGGVRRWEHKQLLPTWMNFWQAASGTLVSTMELSWEGGGGKIGKSMKQKEAKKNTTLLADNTWGLITTKQTKPRPVASVALMFVNPPPPFPGCEEAKVCHWIGYHSRNTDVKRVEFHFGSEKDGLYRYILENFRY